MLISKNIKFLTLLLGFLPSIFVLIMVFKMNFYSPLVTSNKISTENILPQGWAFFTKSPKDVRVEVFDYKTGEEISMKNFSFSNVFGIKRTSTRISMEIATLIKETPDSLWVKSEGIGNRFNKGRFILKKSVFANPYLDGEIIILNRERVPWAWLNFEDKLQTSINYLKINHVSK